MVACNGRPSQGQALDSAMKYYTRSVLFPSDEFDSSISCCITSGGARCTVKVVSFYLCAPRHLLSALNVMSNPVPSDAIVGFAFGQGPPRTSTTRRRPTSIRTRLPTPGGTNHGLAWSVAALLRKYRALGLPRPPLYLQQEIADAMGTDDVDPATDYVIPSNPPDGAYVDTVAVARKAVARFGPASRVLVVAHPDHAPRCIRTLIQLGATPVRTRYLQPLGGGIPWTRFGCDRRGYWRQSTQHWTRSRRRFLAHERRGRRRILS